MGAEPSHVQLVEYKKEVIPYINWMMEDIFCRYGVSIPYYLLEFDFPEYPFTPQHIPSGYGFGLDWGEWGSFLPWFNELIGLAFDLADLPRWQLTSWDMPPWEMPDWKWKIPDWEFPEWDWDWRRPDLPESKKRKWRRKLETDRPQGGGVDAPLFDHWVWHLTEPWTVAGMPSSWVIPPPEGGESKPRFGEPTISPQLADILNERISALYDAVVDEFTTWGTPVQLTDFTDDVYTPDLDINDDTIYYFWQNLTSGEAFCQITTGTSDLEGASFTSTEQTTTEYWKDDTFIIQSGSTLYYLWREKDDTGYYQLYTATSDLDGSNWSSVRRTTDSQTHYSCKQQVVGNTIYFAWINFPTGTTAELWTATMGTDGTGWSDTKRRDLSRDVNELNYVDFHVVGDTIYYTWNESNSNEELYTGTMGTDGSGWTATQQRTSSDLIEKARLYVTDDKIHLTWLEESSNSEAQIWTGSADTDESNWSGSERTTLSDGVQNLELIVYEDIIYYVAAIYDGSYRQIHTARMDTDDTGWAITQRTTSSYAKEEPQLKATADGIFYVWKEDDDSSILQLWMNTLT